MQSIVLVIHVLLALGLIGLILMQHGKGADMGAAFGSGSSGTVFGAQGAGNFLTRLTAILATLFFLTSLVLAYLSTEAVAPTSVVDQFEEAPAAVQVPDESVPPAAAQPSNEDVPVVPVVPAAPQD
ncbi:MAG: preprotein translocase subunit SecG [Gammaproteobacteria bacterium]